MLKLKKSVFSLSFLEASVVEIHQPAKVVLLVLAGNDGSWDLVVQVYCYRMVVGFGGLQCCLVSCSRDYYPLLGSVLGARTTYWSYWRISTT